MGKKVLIVDDSLFTRKLLKDMFTELGVSEFAEAANGNEAVASYEINAPDLVIMDIMMPKMDGIEAIKIIKSKDANARIVVYTSTNQEILIKDAMDAGALEVITKPITKEAVTEIVRKYL